MSDVDNGDPREALTALQQAQRSTQADASMSQGPWWLAVVHGTALTALALSISDIGSTSLFLFVGIVLNIAGSQYLARHQRIRLRPGTNTSTGRFVLLSGVVALVAIATYWALVLFYPETLGFDLIPVGLIAGWLVTVGAILVQWFVVERRRRQIVSS